MPFDRLCRDPTPKARLGIVRLAEVQIHGEELVCHSENVSTWFYSIHGSLLAELFICHQQVTTVVQILSNKEAGLRNVLEEYGC